MTKYFVDLCGCLGYTGDDILPSYMGIIFNHKPYKDLYEPISIMECHEVFFLAKFKIMGNPSFALYHGYGYICC